MQRRFRSLPVSIALATLVVASACKSTTEPAAGSGLQSADSSSSNKKKIAADIKSFNDTQAALVDANKRGASGCEKLDILWKKIEETKQAESDLVPPNANPVEVLTFGNGSANRFWRIFKGWGDQDGGSEIRPYESSGNNFIRLTHRYAVLAKLKFIVDADAVKRLGYTGHYATGNDCVLGRLSSAVPTGTPDRFTPAMAAKFFVSGASESQVLITQHDIGGQSFGTDYTVDPPVAKKIDNNYYTHYLSNRLSFEKGVLSGVGAFSRFFYSAQYFAKNIFKLDYIVDPRELQANHLAEKSPDGSVPANPKGPRFVWTVAPNPEIKASFAAKAEIDKDFRHHFLSLTPEIAKNPDVGLPIFKVYASDTWTYEPEKDATLIGQLVTNSEFVSSEAADVRLFFKHHIQFHKVPDSANEPSPYTQDYPFAQWGDELFTGDCRLGVKNVEVTPRSLTALDGTFLRDATINPKTLRRTKDGKICIIGIIESKLEGTLAPYLAKSL